MDPVDYPARAKEEEASTHEQWKQKKVGILDNVKWMLGEKPVGVTNPEPQTITGRGRSEEKFGSVIERPAATSFMARHPVSPYKGFGDYLYGYLYYPREMKTKEKLPVVIYLHEYDYSKGFSSMGFHHDIKSYIEDLVKKGFAVFAYDMIGFGTRQEEGRHFYQRYPDWSKMGKMVTDVIGAVDALTNMDIVDDQRIYATGYSLGSVVGLYATALDKRIAGLASISGFTPMRSGDKNQQHLEELSSEQMLLPRLGLFREHPDKIPYDYEDVLAAIAPRPVLVIAPQYNQEADPVAIQSAVQKATKIYEIFDKQNGIDLSMPPDYNQFSPEMRQQVINWLVEKNK